MDREQRRWSAEFLISRNKSSFLSRIFSSLNAHILLIYLILLIIFCCATLIYKTYIKKSLFQYIEQMLITLT